MMKMTSLTPREREVCLLVAEHKTNREIGEELGIAETTVNGYVQRVGRFIPGRGSPKSRIAVWVHRELAENGK
jgi:FixJ family two-component response regulator